MQSEKLLQSLIEQTNQITYQAEKFKTFDLDILTWRENNTSWNILECLEHLNLYGDFYLLQIETKIKNSKTKSELDIKSGLLGNYFAESMLPKEKLNKMKTFKDKNPLNAQLDKSVIDKFLSQQKKLISILHQAKNVSLNKIKIETSISSLLKLKLGDTFQFFINHIVRHFKQIEKIQIAMYSNKY
ncbi:MAG TPA: DinB family protein [Chitinophagales bacterium]|nr:DinB family protein [Chitinophagales bacterium]MCB0511834.1 DinB family protein [Bacteroidota bacterium]MCB0514010.1 DinB family protein [Bacteroidota bacterium]MCB9074996.1 DinB family protein [Chitinophagales bacterium]HMU97695.1 DinB family protein [Chitinophagales bacterium]